MNLENVSETNFSVSLKQPVLSEITGLRVDGRKPNELRRFSCRLNVSGDCDGSAYVEQGLTKVLVVIQGPREIQDDKTKPSHTNAIIKCHYSTSVFAKSERRKRPHGDKQATEFAIHLEKVLSSVVKVELFPWSQIDVFVEVLQADGSNFPVAINAATLALVDAGIPLKEYVCSCTCSITKTGVPLMDISNAEELLGCPILTVVILPLSEKIVFTEMSHRFHISLMNDVLNEGIIGCKKIKRIFDETIERHFQEIFNSIEDDSCNTIID